MNPFRFFRENNIGVPLAARKLPPVAPQTRVFKPTDCNDCSQSRSRHLELRGISSRQTGSSRLQGEGVGRRRVEVVDLESGERGDAVHCAACPLLVGGWLPGPDWT